MVALQLVELRTDLRDLLLTALPLLRLGGTDGGMDGGTDGGTVADDGPMGDHLKQYVKVDR